MKPRTSIFSDEGVGFLDQIAAERALLAFDYEGTLAPSSDAHDLAEMRPETRVLLRTTARLYPCAVISSRTRAEAAGRVEGIPLIGVIGSEGPETSGPLDKSMRSHVAEWQARLERTLARAKGVAIENRGLFLALNYHHAPSSSEARNRIREAVAQLGGAIAFHDQGVVKVLPEEVPTRANAIRQLCQRFALNVVVNVGDDSSEEQAFRCDLVTAAFRIGIGRGSHARFELAGQVEMDELMQALVLARTRIDGPRGGGDEIIRALRRDLGRG